MFNRYWDARAWERACAEADRLDPGWRWEDLLARRPILPDDRDAIRVSLAAAAKLPPGWPDWPAVMRDEGLPLPLPSVIPEACSIEERYQAAVRQLEADLTDLPPNQRPAALPLRALRAALPGAVEARELALRLADLSAGRAPEGERPILIHLPVDTSMRIRSVAVMLRLHVPLAVEDGRLDEALADARAMLGLARAAAEPLMLITALVATAVRLYAVAAIDRALAQGEPSPADLAGVQRDIQDAVDVPLLLEAVRGERALNEDLVRAVDQGRVTRQQIAELEAFDITPVTGWHVIDRWIYRLRGGGFSKHRTAGIVRYYTALVELLKESPDAPKRRPDAWAAIRRVAGAAVVESQRGLDGMFDADRRQRALLASLAAALAAERFRRDSGRWPAALAELVPAYLMGVPTDPYDFRPLRYRRLADGIVIYALGPDERDSDGAVGTVPGPGPFPDDVGVRLWDVAHRRQPPQPAS